MDTVADAVSDVVWFVKILVVEAAIGLVAGLRSLAEIAIAVAAAVAALWIRSDC